jgi:hypothetical protein
MEQLDYSYRGSLSIEGVEEHLLDNLCDNFDSNVKEVFIKVNVDLGEYTYRNIIVQLENGIELDCEYYKDGSEEWMAIVQQKK